MNQVSEEVAVSVSLPFGPRLGCHQALAQGLEMPLQRLDMPALISLRGSISRFAIPSLASAGRRALARLIPYLSRDPDAEGIGRMIGGL
jgi:hypothetical protein